MSLIALVTFGPLGFFCRKNNSVVVTVMVLLFGKGKDLFKIIVKPRMFRLGIVPKEVLFRLFSPFNLKILDLYLEKWLCRHWYVRKKAFKGEWIYEVTWKHTLLTICLCLTFYGYFLSHSHIVILISLYLILSTIIIT